MANFQHTRERVIVALDTTSPGEIREIIEDCTGKVWGVKIGLEAIMAFGGPRLVKLIHQISPTARIFFDGKFHDIGNTIAGATRAIARYDNPPELFNIHASAGIDGIKKAVEAKAGSSMKLLGVTVLTSHSDEQCEEIFGLEPLPKVMQFAEWLAAAGADGLVCSAEEVASIKENSLTAHLLAVVPGIRLQDESRGDQSRVMTPKKAILAGADLLVIGRPITEAKSRVEALERIEANLE